MAQAATLSRFTDINSMGGNDGNCIDSCRIRIEDGVGGLPCLPLLTINKLNSPLTLSAAVCLSDVAFLMTETVLQHEHEPNHD